MMTVAERVERNQALGPYHLQGDDREAARLLFSWLADVEQVAVLAAERGDGIAGQLEDELSHRDSFARIAERLGGRTEMEPETHALLRYLAQLEGEASLVALNVVAESWLEGVFDALAATPLAPELFATVEAEELRHAEEARGQADADGRHEAVLRDVELLLSGLAQSPAFLCPMQHLIGVEATARMGLANLTRHRVACAALGLAPGSEMRDLEVASRAALVAARTAPAPIEPNGWERSKRLLWDRPAPMMVLEEASLPASATTEAEVEALVAQRLALALVAHPELNRTLRDGDLFAPRTARIGVRTLVEHDQVTTIYIDDAHAKPLAQVRAEIRRKRKRARRRAYRPVPDIRALRRFMPAPRAAATLTQVGGFGLRGWAPFAMDEGASIAVTVGRQEMVPRFRGGMFVAARIAWLGIAVDHRANDGKQLGRLVKMLEG